MNGISLAGVVVTCLATARKSESAMKISQAVTDTKIQELTREVRLHNGFASGFRWWKSRSRFSTIGLRIWKGERNDEKTDGKLS